MRDPDRLLSSGGTDAELELLRAADSEEPPAHGPERLRAALGLSVVAAGVIASTNAASGVAHAAAASSAASTASVGTTAIAAVTAKASAAKLALTFMLIAGSGMAVATTAIMSKRADVSVPVTARRELRAESRAPEVREAAPAPAPQVTPPQPVPVRRPPPPVRSIARETEQLDAARAALHAGASHSALATLDHYQRENPRGVLHQEASLLRIEALWQVGERRRARRAATRFLQDNPQSPHAARIRSLVGSESHDP